MLYPKLYASIFAVVALIHIVVFSMTLRSEEHKEILTAQKVKKNRKQLSIQTVKIKLKPKVEEFVELAKAEVKREIKKIQKKSAKKIKKVVKKRKKVRKKIKDKPKKIDKVVKEEVVEDATVEEVEDKKVKQNKEANRVDNELNKEMQRYLIRLQYELEKRKVYPPEAKKKKYEGIVLVSFVIQKNGTITHINIVRGCLHPSLNKAALEILKKLKRFEPIPDKFKKDKWAIQVPIRYKIINEF